MRKKMQKMHRHKLLYEDVLKQVEKEDVAFFSKCTKFRDQPPQPNTLDRALQFLWLKEKKIDRKVALQFGQRRVCKIDSTLKHDGPSSARIIKTIKTDQGMINGWYNGSGDSKFDLGPQYNTKQLEKNNEEIEYEELIKQDQQSPSEYKIKLNHQDIYNNEISEKYSFSNLETKQLLQKLNELKQINKQRNEQPQEYVELEGQRFYHVLNDLQDYLDKKIDNKTLIQEMRAFQTFYPIKRKLQVKQLNPGDSLSQGIESQIDGTQKATFRLFNRTRTIANMKCDLFNTNNYVFNVKEVPNIGQQLRRNHFSQLIEELRENGMKTPREINEVSLENSIKGSQLESSENDVKQIRKFYLKFPKQKGELSQTTSCTKSQRIGTLQSQISNQYLQQPLKTFISNIHGSSTEIKLENPGKFKNRLDSRINKYVKQYIKNQNVIQQNQNVDMTILKEKYKSLKTEREKEITRMYKSQQIEGINNKTVHLQ
ncbi:unnamed protein product [Paramecium pentaurelia]|uniref:Uncharacterized protein n=1 Tax=Paramecium pentaurelia TaxID=43138 RepID=A0A8S1XW63_9CILI|nr:unnamed protein product [Paramecium pentaurelia]